MRQKITWIIYLLIGTINFYFNTSCKKNGPDYVLSDFVYLNSTSFDVILTAYCAGTENPYMISAGGEIKIRMAEGELANKIIISDSLSVKYSSSDSIMFYPETIAINNPIRLENYEHRQITSNHHEFRFVF